MEDRGEYFRKYGDVDIDSLKCNCGQEFREPRILRCLHSLCKNCLDDLTNRLERDDRYKCPYPKCQQEMTWDTNRLNGIPKNDFYDKLADVKGDQLKSGKMCGICLVLDNKRTEAVARCFEDECDLYLCQDDWDDHKKQSASKDHEVLKLETITNKLNIYGDKLRESQCVKCRKDNEKIEAVCTDCSELVCKECSKKGHRRHTMENPKEYLKKVYPESKQVAEEYFKAVKEQGDLIPLQRDNAYGQIQEAGTKAKSQVAKWRQDMMNLVDEKAKDMEAKIDEYAADMNEEVNQQVTEEEQMHNFHKTKAEFLYNLHQYGHPDEILQIKADFDTIKIAKEQKQTMKPVKIMVSQEITFNGDEAKEVVSTGASVQVSTKIM